MNFAPSARLFTIKFAWPVFKKKHQEAKQAVNSTGENKGKRKREDKKKEKRREKIKRKRKRKRKVKKSNNTIVFNSFNSSNSFNSQEKGFLTPLTPKKNSPQLEHIRNHEVMMKYRNEDDKCYGVAGMALGLSMFDAGDLVAGVTLDAQGLDCVQFTPEFYFNGNPRLNAKQSWHTLYAHYQITMGLVIANTMCRKMLLDHGQVDRKMREELLNAVAVDGKEVCNLERDEVEGIFNKYFNHMARVFGNRQIGAAVREMASRLKQQRTFTRLELRDLMQELDLID